MKIGSYTFITLLITFALALSACTGTPQTQPEPTPGEALQADAAEYARQFGLSQEEALHRLQVQDEVGGLGAALQQEQADTFSGLWLQHEPEFRVIVAFTRNGKQTMQPYLRGKDWADLVEIRTLPHTLAELEVAQGQVSQITERLGIAITSGVSVIENRVTVEVGNPELFREELRTAGLELPELVELVAIDPQSLPDTLRGEVETYQAQDGQTIYFPKQPPTNIYMAALLEGNLILDANGCLQVEDEAGDGRFVLWHHDFSLQIQGEQIEVLNGAGRVVASVGAAVRMGGGEVPASNLPALPPEACPGPYWVLGEIQTPLDATTTPDTVTTQTPTPFHSEPIRIPTLPLGQVEAAVLELFRIRESCQPPCWGGITPGSTTWEEAKDLLSRIGGSMSSWDYPDGLAGSAVLPVPTHSVSQKIAQSGQMNVTIYAAEGIVQQIVLEDPANFPDYTLPALLTRYGPPAEVLISTTNRPGSTVIPFTLILFYPQHGLMATYLDLTEVKDNSLMGCFHYTPGPVLNFWPVQEDTSFASTYEKLTTGSAEEFRPLQEVTTLDIPRFTELLKDSDYPCVETPAKYWPLR